MYGDWFNCRIAVVNDRGFFLTLQAIRTQLAAMPNQLYLVRLIHHPTGRAFPGERLWTAEQLTSAAIVRFLRVRNCEGCDIYVQPYVDDHNAGYILLDLDHAAPAAIATMRAHGHDPCVVPAGSSTVSAEDPIRCPASIPMRAGR